MPKSAFLTFLKLIKLQLNIDDNLFRSLNMVGMILILMMMMI